MRREVRDVGVEDGDEAVVLDHSLCAGSGHQLCGAVHHSAVVVRDQGHESDVAARTVRDAAGVTGIVAVVEDHGATSGRRSCEEHGCDDSREHGNALDEHSLPPPPKGIDRIGS